MSARAAWLPRALGLCVAGWLAVAACDGGRQDLKPPPGFVAPPIRPLRINPAGEGRLGFGAGFSPLEVGLEGNRWRWMGRRGEVRLANRRARMRLELAGWLPLEFIGEPPTIQLSLGGRVLARFVEPRRQFLWRYTIEPERLGAGPAVLLVIETDKTGRAPFDPRDLGVSVERLIWEVE